VLFGCCELLEKLALLAAILSNAAAGGSKHRSGPKSSNLLRKIRSNPTSSSPQFWPSIQREVIGARLWYMRWRK